MSCTSKHVLINQAVVTDITTEKISLSARARNMIGFLKISNYVSGTFTVKIQHSPNGTDWFDLIVFGLPKVANGIFEDFPIKDAYFFSCFQYVRATLDDGGVASDATVQLELHYGE